jgi:hypothetical protein
MAIFLKANIMSTIFSIFTYFLRKHWRFSWKTVLLGVDVMNTIFCDFRQFSAKIGVFLKNQCYDQNFA